MSSIRSALNKLDNAVGKLDSSVTYVENALQDYAPAVEVGGEDAPAQLQDSEGNVIDVDFVAHRLDKAIEAVENLLKDEV